jgi:hypothetical protein
MSGGQHDQVPEVDLSVLTDDQRSGVTCINCGTPGGRMRSIVTPNNRQSTMVFVHADTNVCLRRVARYVAELHMRIVSLAEHAADVLPRRFDLDEPW